MKEFYVFKNNENRNRRRRTKDNKNWLSYSSLSFQTCSDPEERRTVLRRKNEFKFPRKK
jgi:hypothetical protein